jgi:hypothetical protein
MAGEAGISMRNWDFAFKKPIADAAKNQPPELARDITGGLFIESGCICRTRHSPDGPVLIQLCNFTANIAGEVTRDDEAETRVLLQIEGELSSELSSGRELPLYEVSAEKFPKLEWIVAGWGSDAIVYPNESRALPSAIQLLSQSGNESNKKPKKRSVVFEHTGWRKVGGIWRYLHAGGSIPPASDKSLSVDFQPPLSGYRLSTPPVGDALIAAVRASLSVLSVAPRQILYPVLAAVFRTVLGPCDFALSIVGLWRSRRSGRKLNEQLSPISRTIRKNYWHRDDRSNMFGKLAATYERFLNQLEFSSLPTSRWTQ